MKVLFDTNVILDVLLDREPFSEQASFLLTKVET
jgi:predicted nucleic acid-binding protein